MISLLNRKALLAPLVEATSQAHNIGVAHRLERLGCQQGAPTRCARHDDAGILLRREFWFSIWCGWVGIPLQHAARGQHSFWNMPLLPCEGFSDIQQYTNLPRDLLLSSLLDGDFWNALTCLGHH